MIYITDDISWFFRNVQRRDYYLDDLYEIEPEEVKKMLQTEKVQIHVKCDFSYKMLKKVLGHKIPLNHKKGIKEFGKQDQLIYFPTKIIFYDDDIITKEMLQHLYKFIAAKRIICQYTIFW